MNSLANSRTPGGGDRPPPLTQQPADLQYCTFLCGGRQGPDGRPHRCEYHSNSNVVYRTVSSYIKV